MDEVKANKIAEKVNKKIDEEKEFK